MGRSGEFFYDFGDILKKMKLGSCPHGNPLQQVHGVLNSTKIIVFVDNLFGAACGAQLFKNFWILDPI